MSDRLTDEPERISVLIRNGSVHLPNGSGWKPGDFTEYVRVDLFAAVTAERDALRASPIQWRDGPPSDDLKDCQFVLGLMGDGKAARVRWSRVGMWMAEGYGSLAEITRHCPVTS